MYGSFAFGCGSAALCSFSFQLSTFNSSNPNFGSKNEEQKTERRSCLDTIGRPARAAPVGDRPRHLFSSPAAQPAGRKTLPALFDSMAGAPYPAIRGTGARCGAPTRGPRRFAFGSTQQNGARGGGAAARGDSP